MTSIQKAAEKSVKERRVADNIRIKAGHMLTFDHLALKSDIVERQTARKVIRKSMIRAAGCLALPLTILYFGAYVSAARLHEDITNVFFLESTMRYRADHMFLEVTTVEDLWSTFTSSAPKQFLDIFFRQTDSYGNLQQRNVTQDDWGDWGLVESFNQIQGAVRFQQTRKTTADYNTPHTCNSAITCQLCRENEGFQTIDMFTSRPPINPDCGSWGLTSGNSGGRRLKGNGTEDAGPHGEERQLRLTRPELRTSFPTAKDQKVNDTFRFWLFPSETQAQSKERLNYFWERNWIDQDTYTVEVRMYLMNAELGRNRLEQLTMLFRFSEAGSVFYERELQTIFLQFWQSGMSMMADFSFFILLLATSCYRVWHMWKAFLASRLFQHLMNLGTAWEWVMILIGWWNMYGFWKMMVWEGQVIDALEPVHRRGWEITQSAEDIDKVDRLFQVGEQASVGLASLRIIFAQYSVVLMFRFFISFGSQPRLAIVLRTMQNVLTDFYHFLIVFMPTFMAYVISGSLIFGRRIETFATIQSSFGACFRIAMESEYDWEDMSAEFFWAAALWSWSFLMLVVLLFLNMVLAIILDIYNETREASFPGEAIWETMAHFMYRTARYRTWVSDKTMDASLSKDTDKGMLTRQDLETEFPNMPESQKQLFFNACRTEMLWESAKDLSKKNLLKLTGSLMDALDVAHQAVHRVVEDEAEDPLASWVKPVQPGGHLRTGHDDKFDVHSFLVKPLTTKGGKQPKFVGQGAAVDSFSADGPEWLQETWQLLQDQRKWIDYANWNLQQMQWQIQRALESRQYGSTSVPIL